MVFAMANATISTLPDLPSYTLSPRPRLISALPDVLLQLLAPVIAYWVVSLFFHILDIYDLFPQYRLHTPAEIQSRNRVTRYEVVRDVIVQQIIQTVFGLGMAYFDPIETVGREEYDVALWARRLRLGQSYIPTFLTMLGFDVVALENKIVNNYPRLTGIVMGAQHSTSTYAPYELAAAKLIYWAVIPFFQFLIAILIVDTWQYFLHRAMHMNKFLYTTLHSRHHRLYVPYAFGALYNHPVEGFLLDTLGTGLAYLVTGMTVRQGMWFFTCSTIKTVDDHCGYEFPWDPLQRITSNNAAYHDIHHQTWGIKTNFSQPFFTFWDRYLNTAWAGGDVSARYQRDKLLAQKKIDAEVMTKVSAANAPDLDLDKARAQAAASQRQVLNDKENGGIRAIQDEIKEEFEAKQAQPRRSRRKTSGFDPKSISDRVAGSLHGRSHAILHADGAH